MSDDQKPMNTDEDSNMDTADSAAPANNQPAQDEDERKLFAGGLPQDAKDNDIREHFSQYGEIESVNLKTDPTTGRSRGFAFIVYKTTEGVDKAVAEAEHKIKNKVVAVKKAQAKQGKIYVGKLKPELSDEEIKSHFAQFGAIATIEQPFDKQKNERKNFCFITFEKEETARKLLKEGTVFINSHELEVKKVTPKPDPRMMGGGGGFGGRGGGRGGGQGQWGGYGGHQAGGWAGGYGGYGDWSGGYGGYGDYYGGQQAWGGYGGGAGGYAGYGGYGAGGKTPRGAGGRGAPGGGRGGRGAPGQMRGGMRQKPY